MSDPAANDPTGTGLTAPVSPATPAEPGAARLPAAGGTTVLAGPPLSGMAADFVAPAPRGLFGAFNELLSRPLAFVQRAGAGGRLGAGRLFGGALACQVLYGLAAGCFTGGPDLLLAAIKVPMVIALTFVLCLPSLYVFGAMSGVDWSARRLLALTAGFAGTLGLLLVGFVPVVWLFSVSSRYLGTAVWLHIILWLLTLGLGWRFLRLSLRAAGAHGVMLPWLLLFCLVSFQVATFLRPVLVRDPGEPFFASGKLSMFEHLGQVVDHDDALRRRTDKPAPAPITR